MFEFHFQAINNVCTPEKFIQFEIYSQILIGKFFAFV